MLIIYTSGNDEWMGGDRNLKFWGQARAEI